MRREDHVDYFLVRDDHIEIDAKLQAWARWVKVRQSGWHCSPMFRQYRSKSWQWEMPVIKLQPNTLDAAHMEKAVAALPEKQREAIRWAYVWATVHPLMARANGHESGPIPMARRLAVSKQGLLELIEQGRTMLRNRGA